MPPARTPIADRLWAKVNKDGPIPGHRPDLGPCWPWGGYVMTGGYGQIGRGGANAGMALAHRVAYEAVHGAIPDGLVIDHLCRNRCCCNPAHLEAVTNWENLLRSGGISARHAAATHCASGHPFDQANTHVTPEGWRRCRECDRRKQGPYATRQRAYVPKPRRKK